MISILPGRRKQIHEHVNNLDSRAVQRLAGKLGYLGIAASPFASFTARNIQQILPTMSLQELKQVNRIPRDLLTRDATIVFLQPSKSEPALAAFLCFQMPAFRIKAEGREFLKKEHLRG